MTTLPRTLRGSLPLALLALLLALGAQAQTLPPGYHVETLVSGLATPCAFDFLPDGRVLFTEQNTGRVRLLTPGGALQVPPVVQLSNVVTGGERGLLGIAVDPAFPARPYVYLFHSATLSHSEIIRCELTGDLAGTGSGDLIEGSSGRYRLLGTIPDQAPNHNGGTLRFASDGTLIASVGDDAFPCGAQDSTGLRGVILRMDTRRLPAGFGTASIAALTPPDNPYASSPDSNARLVLARGLRNPFRVQCDDQRPWLYIGDVGDNSREELDLLALPGTAPQLPAMAGPGANFGWPYREGTIVGAHANECAPPLQPLSAPAYEYDRTLQNGASIIPAGLVPAILTLSEAVVPQPALPQGLYLGDYFSGALVRLDRDAVGTGWQVADPVPGQPSAGHFGEGFRAISDWRVRGTDLWFVRQSVDFAANTGSIGIVVANVPPDPRPVARAVIRTLVNPAQGSATFLVPVGALLPDQLTIHDARGRIVRRYDTFAFATGPDGVRFVWDGADEDGRHAGPGMYWIRLRSGRSEATARVVLLR